MVKKATKPKINMSRCKGCGLCIAFCPQKVYDTDLLGKPIIQIPEKCTGCMMCDYRCPDFAVTLEDIT